MNPVELFHLGPPKTATTWFYQCCAEHPEIAVPRRDSVHYYDMFYAKGPAWYAEQFLDAEPQQKKLDPTPSYIWSAKAPRRIAADNPNARLVVCLRDPIERAFSHYWHLKKKGLYKFEFKDVTSSYDLFSAWIEPGLLGDGLERVFDYFPREQVLIIDFDRLSIDPDGAARTFFEFYGVDPSFRPTFLNQRINVAGPRQTVVYRAVDKAWRTFLPSKGISRLRATLTGRGQYIEGISPELRARLLDLCRPEIERMEQLLSYDLSSWYERR